MAQAPPAPIVAVTFSTLFGDASRDPFIANGHYDDLLSSFNIGQGVNDSPDTVRQRVAAAANQRLPIALLVLVNGILRPYFLPFRRDQAMGAQPHPATDGKLYAYDGELIQGQGLVVELPNNFFNLSALVTVATVASIQGQLAGNLNQTHVGPFAIGAIDTIEVRTRSVVPIPNKYVGLFLSQPEGITPRYYFDVILPAIEADGMAQTCMPLTYFCQMAITQVTLGGGDSPVEMQAPTAPPRHAPLLHQATGLLHHHLPALGAQRTPTAVDLQPLVNTIVAGQQQRQQEIAQKQAEKAQKENMTVENWLGPENFRRLLRYCGVAAEADLPPLWSALAKANAKDRLSILQGKVANEFLAMGAVYEKYTPNLFLLTELTSMRWTVVNPDALESGSLGNAFLFTDSDVEVEQGINRQVGFVQSGGAAPSLADAQLLLKMKINLPGPDDSLRAIRRMQAVYRAVLPVGHPLILFLGNHYDSMKAYDPGWHNYATHVPALRALKGVYHLQWMSLRLTKYFVQLDHGHAAVAPPDPFAIIDCILEQKQWEPNLTEVFTSRYNLRAFLNLHPTAATVTTTPSTVSGDNASLVSGLTNATPQGARRGGVASSGSTPSAATGAQSRVENTHFNVTLFGTYRTSAIKTRAIRQKIAQGQIPPLPASKLDASKPVCLAWHSKGQCNTQCPCAYDHVAYTAEEYAALATWCREHGYNE